MMKLKDFLCLLAGVALLALAFQIKGFAEEIHPYDAAPARAVQEAERARDAVADGCQILKHF